MPSMKPALLATTPTPVCAGEGDGGAGEPGVCCLPHSQELAQLSPAPAGIQTSATSPYFLQEFHYYFVFAFT